MPRLAVITLPLLCLLSACGYKGPLYLPPPNPAAAPPASAPAPTVKQTTPPAATQSPPAQPSGNTSNQP